MKAQSPALQGFVVSDTLRGANLQKNLAPSAGVSTVFETGLFRFLVLLRGLTWRQNGAHAALQLIMTASGVKVHALAREHFSAARDAHRLVRNQPLLF